jgi:hypothetical protein
MHRPGRAGARRIERRAHVRLLLLGLLWLLLRLLVHGRLLARQPQGLRLWRCALHRCLLLALDGSAHIEEVTIHNLAVQASYGCIHHRAVLELAERKVPAQAVHTTAV